MLNQKPWALGYLSKPTCFGFKILRPSTKKISGFGKGNMAYHKNRAIGREEVLDPDRVVLVFHNTDSRYVNRDMLFDLPELQLSHSYT